MELKNPIIITPRLLPGVQIGNAFIAIEYGKPTPRTSGTGRQVYKVTIDGVGKRTYIDETLRSGCQGGSLQEGLSSFLHFLSACAESKGKGENTNLFPKRIREWAEHFSDEISMLMIEVEETKDCIVE
jgi:hypothetical protein